MTLATAATPRPASASRSRRRLAAAAITASVLLGFAASLMLGAVRIPLSGVLDALLAGTDETTHRIILDARLPRALCALLAGVNLAVSGVLLQGVTRNPLADPHIIGVTAGAGVAATIALAALPGIAVALPMVAFLGSMASAVFVYAVSWTPNAGASPVRMVLAGVAVNAMLGAVIGVLITAFADRVPAVMFWTVGSFNGSNWSDLRLILPYTIAGLTLAALLQRQVRILELGDDTASTMGVNANRTRLAAFAAASLLAGSAASIAGLVGFVGLVVPHLIRLLTGSNRMILPLSAIGGGAVLLWSDLIARTALAPAELPVGVITGMIGGPYFIYLLTRSGWLR